MISNFSFTDAIIAIKDSLLS